MPRSSIKPGPLDAPHQIAKTRVVTHVVEHRIDRVERGDSDRSARSFSSQENASSSSPSAAWTTA